MTDEVVVWPKTAHFAGRDDFLLWLSVGRAALSVRRQTGAVGLLVVVPRSGPIRRVGPACGLQRASCGRQGISQRQTCNRYFASVESLTWERICLAVPIASSAAATTCAARDRFLS
jgi:hypothetical protein